MATATTPATDTVEIWCLQLGWSMQRLYRARPSRDTPPAELPERLPGLSRLSRLQRAEIDYGRAQSCLTLIATALGWTEAQTPDITGIATALVPFHPPTTRTTRTSAGDPVSTYQGSVLQAHLALLTAVASDGAANAKAYNLGRALADTARPGQQPEDVQAGFDPNRLAQLRQDLTDLASVLPPHAGKAVAQSLTWWRDVVYVTDSSEVGKERVKLLAGVPTEAPPFRRNRHSTPTIGAVTSSADGTKLLEALPRQGELWRVVLTGEKKPTDLLTADDYLDAAQRAVDKGRRIAARTILAAPVVTATVFAVMTAILVVILVVIGNTNSSGGSKIAAFLVAVAGYLGSLGRAVMPRLKSAAKAVEEPLWQSALDYVSADAITIPPVGVGDRSGWSELSAVLATTKRKADVAATAAQAP
ncbi:MAG TPA: hypothetical protein VHW92_00200 [Mycobacteriales bacterium]|nr:hypothetical protein [Mycobacteriales bacterium]